MARVTWKHPTQGKQSGEVIGVYRREHDFPHETILVIACDHGPIIESKLEFNPKDELRTEKPK